MENKKDDVKEAVISALSKNIAEDIKKNFGTPYAIENGQLLIEISNSNIREILDYLIRKLAEKRYAEGVHSGKEPKDW